MKNSGNQEKIDEKVENSDQKTAKKKRGKPFKNAELHKVFELEFKKLSLDNMPSQTRRKLVRNLAESMLTQGFTISEVAETLDIPKPTVCVWNGKLDDETKAKIEQNILNSIDSNLSQFFNSSLISMGITANYCSSTDYLEKQPIKDVAKFFDTLGNFVFNLIEVKEEASLKEIFLRRAVNNK